MITFSVTEEFALWVYGYLWVGVKSTLQHNTKQTFDVFHLLNFVQEQYPTIDIGMRPHSPVSTYPLLSISDIWWIVIEKEAGYQHSTVSN